MIGAILLIIFCFVFAFLSWRSLLWGVIAISGLLPLYLIRFHLGFLPMTLLEAMILILFLVFLFKNEFRIRDLVSKIPSAWLAIISIWLLVATISVFVSPDKRAALGIWKAYFLEPILFLIVFINVVKKEDLKWIFRALGFSAIYISLFAIYQKFTGFAIPNLFWQAAETRRVTSVFGYPNAVGLYLAPIAVFYFGWLFQRGQKIFWQIFKVAVIILSFLAIIFAVSEGALAAVFLGALAIVLAIKKSRWPALVGLVILLIIVFSSPTVKELVWQKITLKDFSGQLRITMWGETIKMLKDNFFFGAGLSGYQELVAPYHKAKHIEIYLYPHNIFLNFWSELGLLGVVTFILIMIKFFWDSLTAFFKTIHPEDKNLLLALIGAMAAILIHGLVDAPYFKNDLSVLFWLVVGSLIILRKIA